VRQDASNLARHIVCILAVCLIDRKTAVLKRDNGAEQNGVVIGELIVAVAGGGDECLICLHHQRRNELAMSVAVAAILL
jgi:hypothetical protein